MVAPVNTPQKKRRTETERKMKNRKPKVVHKVTYRHQPNHKSIALAPDKKHLHTESATDGFKQRFQFNVNAPAHS